MKLLNKMGSIFDFIIDRLAFLSGILIVLMMLMVTAEVFSRYFLQLPIIGVIEISEIFILWIVFLGTTWLLKIERHVNMDIVLKALSAKAQAWINILTSIICVVICSVLFWYGIRYVLKQFEAGIMLSTLIQVPISIIIAIIPLGFFLLFIQFLRRTYKFWIKLQQPISTVPQPKQTQSDI